MDDDVTGLCTHPDMTVPEGECLALIFLYSGTNGTDWLYNPTWDNNDNWFQTLDVNSWF